jgi:hypothetical protein
VTVQTTIDFTLANGLRARRRLSECAAEDKLAILRRLNRQLASGMLPLQKETNVEQSWNEQVFAKVLGYQTQLSHDLLPFHLKPKVHGGGYYPDFSLGFFGSGPERVFASAELKGPRAQLDAPQPGKYKGLTPVQQAFQAALAQPGCLWVLVSNFVELRLYSIEKPGTPLVRVALADVSDVLDLALLQGLLDRNAILGSVRCPPELATMSKMNETHPGAPVPPAIGEYRLVLRFTPQHLRELPLFRAEQSLVGAMRVAPLLANFFERPGAGEPPRLSSRLVEGWVAVDGQNPSNYVVSRVAVSLLGQVQATFRFAGGTVLFDGAQRTQVELGRIIGALVFFGGVLEKVHPMRETPGLLGAELREAKGKYLDVNNDLRVQVSPSWGIADIEDILAGDFSWLGSDESLTNIEAMCVCELGAHFRNPDGGAAVSLNAVKLWIDNLKTQRSSAGP